MTLDHGGYINDVVQCHLDRLWHRSASRFDNGQRKLDAVSVGLTKKAISHPTQYLRFANR